MFVRKRVMILINPNIVRFELRKEKRIPFFCIFSDKKHTGGGLDNIIQNHETQQQQLQI